MQKKQPQTARYAATEILCDLYETRLPIKVLFERSVKKYKLPDTERSLTMQLVYGVLRHRQFLDRMVEILSTTPLRKIEPFIHQSLVLALYQLFFLERIPESAAVNEAVINCKTAKLPKRLHGFVNGVLRQAIRNKNSLKEQAKVDKSGSTILNHPGWLVEKWQDQFGFEKTVQICSSNSHEPELVLRVNSTLITRESFLQLLRDNKIKGVTGHFGPDAVIVPDISGPITSIPGYNEGYFQVQDEAAQLVTLLLNPLQRDGIYLDGCAGLGSKTAHLMQLGLALDVDIHAIEPESHRQRLFEENISRLFTTKKPLLHCGKLQHFSPEELPLFDGIIIDAPCSGTGVTGRHPDIRWNRYPENILRYQKEQLNILQHSTTLLRPKGILVYVTCSLEKEENFDVIETFLAQNSNFALTDCAEQLPATAHQFISNQCFAPLPSKQIDGFFAARLVRLV